jgi:2-polyprenyl-3-methyl-5-hydroxy-6-metoxy-1,4-benzoquinol methylase
MRTDPRPDAATISYYYPAAYAPHQPPLLSSPVVSKPWRRLAGRAFQFNVTRFPEMKPGRMLEIGCAGGGFLQQMATRGWDVEGLEVSERVAASARSLGFRVRTSSLESAEAPERPFDLIVAWMVIEHLHQPRQALQKIARWLRPGGWLALSVPNAGSLESRIFGDAWYSLDVPRHLFHFTPRTLRLLLAASGWSLRKIHHQRVLSNLTHSIANRLNDRAILPSAARYLSQMADRPGHTHHALYPLALPLSLIGQTGRMTAWAQPASS